MKILEHKQQLLKLFGDKAHFLLKSVQANKMKDAEFKKRLTALINERQKELHILEQILKK